ncbi:gamma carbonic anhydrase family protein [Rhizobium puerariae]|uniref:Gamma carbonic anhydrase family protein n=1 Tax=Rhizobium puerariae TaxID=1585791 RepID=A0ABV6ARL9_9HYPH
MALYRLDTLSPTVSASDQIWLAPNCTVIGNVTIEEDVSIWFGAVLRGDDEPITIGAGTNIQEGVTGHVDPGYPLTIGKGCTIGHHAIVHGCKIGDNCLIGMGATILNGVVLGDNCLVGANALVTEGKIFPPNSLIVGTPAKVVRELDEAAIEGIRRSAKSYQERYRRFAGGLQPVE